MIRPLFLLLFFLVFAGKNCHSQHYDTYWNYDISDGLPTNSIYHLKIDSKGKVWFGSDLGITCFDGQKFKTFTIEDGLNDNTVLRCFEDSKGRIWFHHNNKIPSYYFEGQIHKLELKEENVVTGSHSQFVEMQNGKIYFGCYAGVLVIDVNNPKKCSFIKSLEGSILATCGKYEDTLVYTEINSRKTIQPLKLPTIKTKSIFDENTCFPTYSNIYLNTFGRSSEITLDYLRNYRSKPFYRPKEENIFLHVYFILEKYNKLFYCTKNGIFIYKRYPDYLVLEKHLLKGIQTVSVDFDAADNMWVSSLGNGIFFLPKSNFNEIPLDEQLKISSQTRYMNSLVFGTYNGEIIECNGKETKPFRYRGKTFAFHNPVGSLYFQSDGVFSIETTQSKKYSLGNQVVDIFINMSSYGVTYNPKTKNFYYVNTTGIYGIYGESKRYFSVESIGKVKKVAFFKNVMYAASQNGIKKFITDSTYITAFQEQIQNSRVQDLLVDNRSLFISTSKSGLWQFDGNKLKNYQKKDGLLSNNLSFLSKSKNEAIWIVSDIGLQEVKIQNNKIIELRRIDLKTNIKSNEIIGLEDIGDYLMVTTDKGLFSLNKKEKFKLIKMKLFVDNILVSNRIASVDKLNKIEYGKNIKIVTSAINYTQHATDFYYRMNGGDWIKNNSETFFFPLLSPGDYKLEMYCSSPFYLNSDMKILSFSIQEKWYQNINLIIILFLLMIITIILFVRHRSLKLSERKRKELKTELLSLQSQMNPHFTFNSLNSIQSYMSSHNMREAQIYLADFSNLIRSILDQAKLDLIPLEREISFLKSYIDLEKRRLENQFDYTLTVDPLINIDSIVLPTLMLQPFVENAIWHGLAGVAYKGHLSLRFTMAKNKIVCEIEDDGIGLDAAKEKEKSKPYHKSKGIENCRERIRIFEEIYFRTIELTIKSKESSKGTIVSVSFPIIHLNDKK